LLAVSSLITNIQTVQRTPTVSSIHKWMVCHSTMSVTKLASLARPYTINMSLCGRWEVVSKCCVVTVVTSVD